MIQRAIAIFPVLTGSVRNIQIGLQLLFGVLKPWQENLNQTVEAYMIWSWLNRRDLNITPDNCDWSNALQPILTAFWNALSLFQHSSFLAEFLHSWLHPYLQIHRMNHATFMKS